MDDIVTRPPNTLKLNCGCVLYVNSVKHHGETIYCKQHTPQKDLVAMLRQEWEYGNNAKGCDYEMFAQAADEIERLRAEIEGLREALAMANKFAQDWRKRALKAEGHNEF